MTINPITLDILHFNDVYNVAPAKEDPVGGASRFATAIQQTRDQLPHPPLVVFSGDAFNPSLEGSVTRGSHMTQVLNQVGIDVACVGNHDFDFGVPQLQKLMGQTQFPWLLSNVMYQDGSLPSPLKRWHIVNDEASGLVIGVLGLVEKEWIQTIPSFPSDLLYHDFCQVAQELSTMLRDPQGPYKVDLVLALTHMRVPNDVTLATTCLDAVDLILGGHDHFYYVSKSIDIVNPDESRQDYLKDVGFDPEQDISSQQKPVRIVKSGTDFREFGLLHLTIDTTPQGTKYIQHMTAEHKWVTSSLVPDPAMESIVAEVAHLVSSKTQRAIGYTTVPLDGRSTTVRTQETNMGNLTADLMLAAYSTLTAKPSPPTIALCCGGTIRNDRLVEVGPITMGDVMQAFPFQDPVVVIRLTGHQIWQALENSVSEYPKQEGRFPQVAGVRVEWSSQRPPGQRIQRVLCTTPTTTTTSALRYEPDHMVPLELEKEYVVVTRQYMALGYDGYDVLKEHAGYVVDEENGVFISTIFRKFFLGLKYINAFREHYHPKQDQDQDDEQAKKQHVDGLVASIAKHWRKEASKLHQQQPQPKQDDGEQKWMTDALDGAQLGHPDCIRSEEEEEKEEVDRLQDGIEAYKQHQRDGWVKRWASISPTVQGRLVQLD
ncbi:Metallo-dependent phosphatase-like protein [Absidia repens]|uniref:Metallo-dependent phosphatase-like protein n=1 Tax=Absidia repens TaxID=90262 RepID=A0A1X2I1I5_9FUNG|nr:Metallo-dependent phosphatase-like protein [Absidia repens]